MKRRILPTLVAASVACLLAGAVNAAGVLAPDDDEDDLAPTGKGWGERAYPAHPNGNANGQASRGGPKSSGEMRSSSNRRSIQMAGAAGSPIIFFPKPATSKTA